MCQNRASSEVLSGALRVFRAHIPEHGPLGWLGTLLLRAPVEGVRVVDVGVGAPVVLVGVRHVRIHVPGLRLPHDLRPHAVRLHGAVGAGQRHPVVHGLVNGELGQEDPGTRRPHNVPNSRPNVLGLDQLRRELASPLRRLRVAQVQDVRVRRQRGQRPRQRRHKVRRRRRVVLEDEEGLVAVAGLLEAVLPGADVGGGAATLARAQLQRPLLVGV
mmetsp:Transcript_110733/g.323978  ORF Transcript_110733/g.323978 Transcript_110733/m.323978 type:complete len:216 (-) Transcript_110733:469-1116(-)